MAKYDILDRIDSPRDLKKLSIAELEVLCREIRDYMVDCCSRNPGHLASSLGAVELIVGFHYVYDTPSDKIIFDVGHQAYAHKILTGRREAFRQNRTKDGLAGFPNRSESEYDAFGAGHSSTSISAALGMAEAARLRHTGERVAALIGDGALTGGLAFEGLNNAGDSSADILVILNDNDHSIDDSHGGLRNYLLRVTTSMRYNKIKAHIWNCLGEGRLRTFIQRWLRSLKSWIVKGSGGDLFESLGFRYFGPVDGNSINDVVSTLRKMHSMNGPRLVHFITTKGKGYPAAEADPTTWHAPGKFNPETGERLPSRHPYDRYQDVFGNVLSELADIDDRIVGITPAMSTGCGMNIFEKKHPDRFYDVGIEEEHAVTFSAGLAANGMRPFCNIYSAFCQRAYDQIIHDVALQGLPVVMCLDRAGLVGEDGATHHGAFDIAAYRSIPGTIISAPADEVELKNLMYTALQAATGPFFIRYPRGMGEGADWRNAEFHAYETGKADEVIAGDRVAVIATGPSVHRAVEAAESFPGRIGVYNFRFIKPLDTEMLDRIARTYNYIITIEDGVLAGGLYGAVCEWASSNGCRHEIKGIGIPDRFIIQDSQASQREECGINTESLKKVFEKYLENKN